MGETTLVFRDSDFDNLEFVRQIVLYRLQNDSSWSQFDPTWDEQYQKCVTFDPSRLRKRFVVLANETMWQLLIQGVITAGSDSGDPNLPHFRITDHGRKVLVAGRLIPHDPTGYLDGLRDIKGKVSSGVMFAYIEEALRCFTAGCHVASVLLLGVAAESVFNHMCADVRDSLEKVAEKKKLDPKESVYKRHDWLVKKYNALPNEVKRKLPESLDLTFGSLGSLIRRQRNELGHPQETPPDISREQAFVFFQLFPEFVRDAQALAEYCKQNGL